MTLQDTIDTRQQAGRRPTLTVVLYGGPGTGKSTTAAAVFSLLKQRAHNVEMAHEYAKDLTWEGAHSKLAHQPYVAAKQMWRLDRLDGQVEAVITDTSPLLSLVYGGMENGVTPAFREWLLDDEKRRNTLNFFLSRDPGRAYNPRGRSQTEREARKADAAIAEMLYYSGVGYRVIQMGRDAAEYIADRVEENMG